jgi:hypothetical protein
MHRAPLDVEGLSGRQTLSTAKIRGFHIGDVVSSFHETQSTSWTTDLFGMAILKVDEERGAFVYGTVAYGANVLLLEFHIHVPARQPDQARGEDRNQDTLDHKSPPGDVRRVKEARSGRATVTLWSFNTDYPFAT